MSKTVLFQSSVSLFCFLVILEDSVNKRSLHGVVRVISTDDQSFTHKNVWNHRFRHCQVITSLRPAITATQTWATSLKLYGSWVYANVSLSNTNLWIHVWVLCRNWMWKCGNPQIQMISTCTCSFSIEASVSYSVATMIHLTSANYKTKSWLWNCQKNPKETLKKNSHDHLKFQPRPGHNHGLQISGLRESSSEHQQNKDYVPPTRKGHGKMNEKCSEEPKNTGAFFWTYPFSTETMEVLGERVTWGKKTCKSRKRAKVWQKSRYHHFGFSTLSQIH